MLELLPAGVLGLLMLNGGAFLFSVVILFLPMWVGGGREDSDP
jgi:hypothetical protein